MNVKAVLLLVLRLALGALFVVAGALKAWDPAQFAGSIDNFDLVPRELAAAGALLLPWLEIVCGVALLAGRMTQGAVALLLSLMLLFTVAFISAWSRGLDVSCGCFGSMAGKADYPWAVARNIALVVALVVLSAINSADERKRRA